MNKITNYIVEIIAILLAISCFIVFVIGISTIINWFDGKTNTKEKTEFTTKIDSLKKVNDSIKIVVERLDSIKDAKIIEVQTLDNDSTLKLFYELVSE